MLEHSIFNAMSVAGNTYFYTIHLIQAF